MNHRGLIALNQTGRRVESSKPTSVLMLLSQSHAFVRLRHHWSRSKHHLKTLLILREHVLLMSNWSRSSSLFRTGFTSLSVTSGLWMPSLHPWNARVRQAPPNKMIWSACPHLQTTYSINSLSNTPNSWHYITVPETGQTPLTPRLLYNLNPPGFCSFWLKETTFSSF